MSGAVLATATGRIPDFTATLSKSTLSGVGFPPGTIQTYSGTGCEAVGGVPPYTYLWTYVSGDTSVYANTPTAASTRFSRYISGVASYSAVWNCAVEDSEATTINSNSVTITLEGLG